MNNDKTDQSVSEQDLPELSDAAEALPLQVRSGLKAGKLSIALNTHQSGRTFQDRTYIFDSKP